MDSSKYDMLLKFLFFINRDYDHFIDNVLYALSEFCGYPLNDYAIVNRSPDEDEGLVIEKLVSENISDDYLRSYVKDTYKTDIFLHEMMQNKRPQGRGHVTIIPDIASYEEFYNTAYGQELLSQNMPYRAVIHDAAKDYPLHALALFKTEEEGEFTKEEIVFLEEVSRIFFNSHRLYKNNRAAKCFRHFLDIVTTEENRVMGIVDQNGDLVYQHASFFETLATLLGVSGVSNVLRSFFRWFITETGILPEDLTETQTIQKDSRKITISPHSVDTGVDIQRFLFISIENDNVHPTHDYPRSLRKGVVQEYALTPMESEVAQLLINGMDNSEIADTLCISINTVKYHLSNIFKKTGVTRRYAAIAKLQG